MELVLIPGFWLDASSWDEVTPPLRAAGHRVHALTLPGLDPAHDDPQSVRLADHVATVVATIDRCEEPVVLVGHSAGGPIAHAAADARPTRVARVVHVDTWPLGPGQVVNDELPVVDGVIPLPDWSVFDDEDLVDLDEERRAAFRARAVPQPAAVASDLQVLTDDRRYDVPATVIACEFPSAQLRAWMAAGEPALAELAALRDVEYVDVPTGHWPQLTRPAELAAAILAAVERR